MNEDSPKSASPASHVRESDAPVIEDLCGDFGIRIARDGTWFYHGSPIGRKPLCRLFSNVLRKDDNGEYWLITPVEKGRIDVEDAPFVAVEMTAEGAGPDQILTMRTNLDHIVTLDRDHPLRVSHDPETGEPSPYVLVRDNLEALINRPVYYQLVELGEEREIGRRQVYGVWSKEEFFVLGELAEKA